MEPLAPIFLAALMVTVPPPATAASRSKKKVSPAPAPAASARGSLTGVVIIKGKVKKMRKFNPYADVYGGGAGSVTPKSDEPGHLAVYLEGDAAGFPAPAEHAVLDQQDRAFSTDLLPILAGTAVDFTNHDRIYHNVFSYSQPAPFDLGRRAQGEKRTVVFDKLPPRGIGIIKINCEIHANMRATVLVMRNPYWVVLPETGGPYRLDNLPPGTWTLTGWHAGLAAEPVTVTVRAGETTVMDLTLHGGS